MSLKKFHLLFITTSVALCVFFGIWCLRRYGEADGASYVALAALAAAVAVGLVGYEVWFLKRMKGVNGS